MFYWQADRPFIGQELNKLFFQRHKHFDLSLAKKAIELGMGLQIKQMSGIIPFGSVNVILKAKLVDNREVIFRGHPPKVINTYFWSESLIAETVRLHHLPAYKTYLIDDSRKFFDFDYMLMESLPGENMKTLWPIKPDLDSQLMLETGQYLAKIHSIKTKKFGFFNNQIAKKEHRLVGIHNHWSEHITAALTENLKFLIKNQIITILQKNKLEKVFVRNKNLLKLKQGSLIHNDLADWNLLVNNNHISGIIDWDESHSGDPVMDFACFSLFFPENRLQTLIQGYQQEQSLPEKFEEKFHLYRLRYIISKITLRKKRLVVDQDKFIQKLLEHGLKAMQAEFKYYGL